MKEKSNLPMPELLAPAGSPAALEAAIEAGADAVYFGGTEFSNRMRAKNFDSQGIIDAIRLCRTYSVASHITLNTRLRDRELPRVLGYAAELYEAGADAFIVADLGLAALIKRELPDISLHASTQLTGSSTLDAETFAAFGFDRMVCPRELSCEELFRLVRSSPISIEAFVHGAHCVSVSGQCLMSWAIGGRSGNRGECAQPCRLPFTCLHGCSRGSAGLREKSVQINADTKASYGSPETEHSRSFPAKGLSYPLSLKDMCLAAHIPELINTGVSSLKIEGRLKSPDYVYGVTRIYRRLLDERRAATSEELRELESIFSRGGFTDGYFTNRYSSMCGIRSKNALPSPVKFTALSRKIPLAVSVKVKAGEPVTLTVSEKVAKFNRFAPRTARTVSVSGVSPERARTAPLTEESLYRSLSKLGSTPFILSREDINAEINGEVWMTAAQINELRRRAISALEEAGKRNHTDLYIKTDLIEGIDDLFAAFDGNAGTSVRTSVQNNIKEIPDNHTYLESDYARYALFRRREQIPSSAPDFFDIMFIPFSELPEKLNPEDKLALAMDPFSTSDEETERILSGYAARGGRQVLVSALSQLVLACRYGLEPAASFRFNITNTVSAAALASIGARLITLSPELPTAAMRDVAARLNKGPHRQPVCVSAVVYGKLPLMLLKRCILGSVGDKFSGKSAEVNSNAESNPRGRCGRVGGAAVCPTGELTDRKGTKFPVLPIGRCMNEIVNSCPIWSADSAPVKGLSAGFFIFTDESSREAENVIDAYSRCLPPLVRQRIRRM